MQKQNQQSEVGNIIASIAIFISFIFVNLIAFFLAFVTRGIIGGGDAPMSPEESHLYSVIIPLYYIAVFLSFIGTIIIIVLKNRPKYPIVAMEVGVFLYFLPAIVAVITLLLDKNSIVNFMIRTH